MEKIHRESAILLENDRKTTSFTWPHLVSGFSANLNPSNLDPQKPTAIETLREIQQLFGVFETLQTSFPLYVVGVRINRI